MTAWAADARYRRRRGQGVRQALRPGGAAVAPGLGHPPASGGQGVLPPGPGQARAAGEHRARVAGVAGVSPDRRRHRRRQAPGRRRADDAAAAAHRGRSRPARRRPRGARPRSDLRSAEPGRDPAQRGLLRRRRGAADEEPRRGDLAAGRPRGRRRGRARQDLPDHQPRAQPGDPSGHGFWVYGLDERGERTLAETEFDAKTVLVVGAEGEGLRQRTKPSATRSCASRAARPGWRASTPAWPPPSRSPRSSATAERGSRRATCTCRCACPPRPGRRR